MEICELDPLCYEEFASSCAYTTYYQSVAFTEMKRREGWNVYYLGGYQDDTLCAASAIVSNSMFGKYQYCCAIKGFLLDYSNAALVKSFSKGVIQFLKQKQGLFLRINPAFLLQEHDGNGAILDGGFDHHSWVQNVLDAGFQHEGYTLGVPSDQHVRWTFVLPLKNEDETSLKKQMSKLTQRNLKSVDKYHIQVHEITKKEDLTVFLNIMQHTAERRNFSTFTKSYYEDLFTTFYEQGMVKFLYAEMNIKAYHEDLLQQIAKSETKLLQIHNTILEKGESEKLLVKLKQEDEAKAILVRKKQEIAELWKERGDNFPIATANFMIYHNEITYFHGGSYDEYMHFCGQFALQWYMIQYGLKHQFKRYNFNGISGIFDDRAADYGVYTFKKGFGGHVEEYPGYFHMPIRKYTYRLLQVSIRCKRAFKK